MKNNHPESICRQLWLTSTVTDEFHKYHNYRRDIYHFGEMRFGEERTILLPSTHQDNYATAIEIKVRQSPRTVLITLAFQEYIYIEMGKRPLFGDNGRFSFTY